MFLKSNVLDGNYAVSSHVSKNEIVGMRKSLLTAETCNGRRDGWLDNSSEPIGLCFMIRKFDLRPI